MNPTIVEQHPPQPDTYPDRNLALLDRLLALQVADPERYAAIPEGASVCPACGVYAGDIFDGKLPKQRRSRAWWWLALIVVAATAGWMFAPWPTSAVGYLLNRIGSAGISAPVSAAWSR